MACFTTLSCLALGRHNCEKLPKLHIFIVLSCCQLQKEIPEGRKSAAGSKDFMFHRIWFCFSKPKHLVLIGQEDNLPPVNQHLAALFVLQVRWTKTIKHVELWPQPIHLHWVLLASKPVFLFFKCTCFSEAWNILRNFAAKLWWISAFDFIIFFYPCDCHNYTCKGSYVDMGILPA